MSHNINENRMFYTGDVPWHGLGTKLNNPATASEAIAAAQLNYPVELQQLYLVNNTPYIGKKATVRKDTGSPLGIVSDRYKIVQNVDAFNFFDVVVGEGQAIYHTAGALGLGERIWIMAKLPQDLVLVREDIVEKYLLLTNSHDGTSSLKMYFTPVRVVCQNTLNMSLKDASSGIAIRHTGNIHNKVEEARRILGIAVNYYKQFEEIAKKLVDVKLNVEQAEGYFDKLFEGSEDTTALQNKKEVLLTLFETGKGNDIPEIKHSAWAAYNAVTEYADHYKTVKNSAKNPSARLKDCWFGTGAILKDKAYDGIIDLAGISIKG